MYRKPDREQMEIEVFVLPFGGRLDPENRWVKMAALIPWDMVEDIYAQSFKSESLDGSKPINARVAFGALYIKEYENLTQDRTVEHISENVCMQYFLGLKEYTSEPLFDSSMLTHFAKRFSKDDIARINEEMYRRVQVNINNKDDDDNNDGDSNVEAQTAEAIEATSELEESNNKGVLILDATVAPSDIRYPTDLGILNECREKTEEIIDEIWDSTERKGHKTAYNRKRARKRYLSVAKQRKPRKKKIQQAVREQLEYVEKNLETLDRLMPQASFEDNLKYAATLETIRAIAEQQRFHYDNPGKPIPNRIVSVSQPHVRPMPRGKARGEIEFGQKISFSIVDGYTFIDNQSWDNFAEGKTLQESVEKYKERCGVYPEAVLADKAYRNRDNINYCKERGIRLSGPRLGCPKQSEIEADKEQAYQDSRDRNMVEGRIGINKRRYGMDLIYAKLAHTGEVEVAMNVFCMNVACSGFSCAFFRACFLERLCVYFIALLTQIFPPLEFFSKP
jgi:hypothetical protein